MNSPAPRPVLIGACRGIPNRSPVICGPGQSVTRFDALLVDNDSAGPTLRATCGIDIFAVEHIDATKKSVALVLILQDTSRPSAAETDDHRRRDQRLAGDLRPDKNRLMTLYIPQSGHAESWSMNGTDKPSSRLRELFF